MFTVEAINTMQTGDLIYLSDTIFFTGCSRNCAFCFNKKLKDSTVGELMSADDIISKLSNVKWVSFIGGEPLEQNIKEMKMLLGRLRKMGKKVALFTSYQEPWNIITGFNHYHIDVKCFDWDIAVTPPRGITASYGVVSYFLTPTKLDVCFGSLDKSVPVYMKTCQGMDWAGTPRTDYVYLKTVMGMEHVYLDAKIRV